MVTDEHSFHDISYTFWMDLKHVPKDMSVLEGRPTPSIFLVNKQIYREALSVFPDLFDFRQHVTVGVPVFGCQYQYNTRLYADSWAEAATQSKVFAGWDFSSIRHITVPGTSERCTIGFNCVKYLEDKDNLPNLVSVKYLEHHSPGRLASKIVSARVWLDPLYKDLLFANGYEAKKSALDSLFRHRGMEQVIRSFKKWRAHVRESGMARPRLQHLFEVKMDLNVTNGSSYAKKTSCLVS
jgi:hypothetical protein